MPTFVTLAIVGLIAQLVDGSLGMAYGVTSTTLLLTAGLSPAAASASVHLAEVGTTLASGLSHWRFDNVDWRTVRRMAVPGAAGAFTGAVVLSSLSTEAAKPWMAGVLLALGVFVLVRFAFGPAATPKGRPYVRHRHLAALGLVAGFVDATGGGGWGPVATPTLLATGKMEPRKVIGSVDTSEFVIAVAASAGFFFGLGGAGVSTSAVVALLLGGLMAAPIAAWLVRRAAPRLLGAAVGGLIILTNVRTLLNHFEIPSRTAAYLAIAGLWVLSVAWAVHTHRMERAVAAAPEEPESVAAV